MMFFQLLSYIFIVKMLSTPIQRQQNTKSTVFNHSSHDRSSKQQTQTSFKVDILPLTSRKLQIYQPLNKQSRALSKKSHRSLKDREDEGKKRSVFKLKVKKQEELNTEIEGKEKQLVKEQIKAQQNLSAISKVNPTESSQGTNMSDFVQKKMRIGKKNRSNAMKQFILETLMKAKASTQATCLIIHKGTSQSHSPPRHENLSIKKNKVALPIIKEAVEDVSNIKNKRQKLFGMKIKRPNQAPKEKSAIMMPLISGNKKWVQMTRKFQKKFFKYQPQIVKKSQQIQQLIQQNQSLLIKQQLNKSEQQIDQQIKQQIAAQNVQG